MSQKLDFKIHLHCKADRKNGGRKLLTTLQDPGWLVDRSKNKQGMVARAWSEGSRKLTLWTPKGWFRRSHMAILGHTNDILMPMMEIGRGDSPMPYKVLPRTQGPSMGI